MQTSRQMYELIDDVQELLTALKNEPGPEVQVLRKRVEKGIRSTKQAIARDNGHMTARIGMAARSMDAYITRYPRLAFASAAIVAGAVGRLLGASGRS